jgi:Mg2+ and Co2+ transporter CorA|tara:strand:+ start:309 stop:593 length:285 start_codon:yes stop_codon:yes gene_type:complete
MEIKPPNLLSLLPMVVLATGAIFSYASLDAMAAENAEDIEDVTEQVEKIEDEVDELQQQMTRTEIQIDNAVQDLSEVRSDTKAILNLLQRQPTQ